MSVQLWSWRDAVRTGGRSKLFKKVADFQIRDWCVNSLRSIHAFIAIFMTYCFEIRQAMYVKYNPTLTRLVTLCCSGKAISIIYSECVFVALGIENALLMHHIVICSLSGTTVFCHVIS